MSRMMEAALLGGGKTLRRPCVALLMVCGAALGCGDDAEADAGPTCEPEFAVADACGGDLVGTWTLDDACGRLGVLAGIEAECAQIEVLSESVTGASGTLEVRSDNTYVENLNVTGEVDFTIASSCVESLVSTCTELSTRLTAAFNQDTTVQCADSPGGCRCQIDGALTRQSTGTYALSGASVTLDDGLTYSYCVNEDTLALRSFAVGGVAVTPTFFLTAEL